MSLCPVHREGEDGKRLEAVEGSQEVMGEEGYAWLESSQVLVCKYWAK